MVDDVVVLTEQQALDALRQAGMTETASIAALVGSGGGSVSAPRRRSPGGKSRATSSGRRARTGRS